MHYTVVQRNFFAVQTCACLISHTASRRELREVLVQKKKITEYSIYTTALHNTYTRITIQYIRRIPPSKQRKFSENLQSIISRRYIWSASNNLTVCIEWTCSIRYAYQQHILQLQAYNYTIYSYRGTHEHDVLPSGSLFFSLSLSHNSLFLNRWTAPTRKQSTYMIPYFANAKPSVALLYSFF